MSNYFNKSKEPIHRSPIVVINAMKHQYMSLYKQIKDYIYMDKLFIGNFVMRNITQGNIPIAMILSKHDSNEGISLLKVYS